MLLPKLNSSRIFQRGESVIQDYLLKVRRMLVHRDILRQPFDPNYTGLAIEVRERNYTGSFAEREGVKNSLPAGDFQRQEPSAKLSTCQPWWVFNL